MSVNVCFRLLDTYRHPNKASLILLGVSVCFFCLRSTISRTIGNTVQATEPLPSTVCAIFLSSNISSHVPPKHRIKFFISSGINPPAGIQRANCARKEQQQRICQKGLLPLFLFLSPFPFPSAGVWGIMSEIFLLRR